MLDGAVCIKAVNCVGAIAPAACGSLQWPLLILITMPSPSPADEVLQGGGGTGKVWVMQISNMLAVWCFHHCC